jgi:hypothetical protein
MHPHAAVVIPSLSGGWIEIGRPTDAALLDLWRRKHEYDPALEIGRLLQAADLVSTVAIHAADGSVLSTPIVWPHDTQRRFVHFLASIARMTFAFPQRATFSDTDRFGIEVDAYREHSTARPAIHLRLHVRVVSAFRDAALESGLVLDQAALSSIVSSCCAVFPGLGEDDLRAAWN